MMSGYVVAVEYRDGTGNVFHCDDYGHTSGDNWIVLRNNNEPYVMLSKDNVKSIMFSNPELVN